MINRKKSYLAVLLVLVIVTSVWAFYPSGSSEVETFGPWPISRLLRDRAEMTAATTRI